MPYEVFGYQGHLQDFGRFSAAPAENLQTLESQQQGRCSGLQHLRLLRCLWWYRKWKTCIGHLHFLCCLYNQNNEILIFSGTNSSLEMPLFLHWLCREPWPTVPLKKVRHLGIVLFFSTWFLLSFRKCILSSLRQKAQCFSLLFCFDFFFLHNLVFIP